MRNRALLCAEAVTNNTTHIIRVASEVAKKRRLQADLGHGGERAKLTAGVRG